MKKLPRYLFALWLFSNLACNHKSSFTTQTARSKLPLQHIRLPDGFHIELYAGGLKNARSMTLSPSGTLFVGTRRKGEVYAVQDADKDYFAEKQFTIARKLNMPNGVAFKDGHLYVSALNQILRFDNIEQQLAAPPTPQLIYDQYPAARSHGWKYIAFGPDGKLYVPVGAPCNICEPKEEVYASITRLNTDGSGFEIVQRGIRNTVGFTWHPRTKELWFTDNGRDWLGDDLPACELNHAPRDGMHFGYPYCHQGDLPDPEYGELRNCDEFTAPAQKLGPHVAPLGLEFVPAGNFPAGYVGHILIAEHGSWNRADKIGYRLALVRLAGSRALSYETFAEGWLQGGDEVWGRPVDLEFMPDGSLLVSDDYADAIYRIYYKASVE